MLLIVIPLKLVIHLEHRIRFSLVPVQKVWPQNDHSLLDGQIAVIDCCCMFFDIAKNRDRRDFHHDHHSDNDIHPNQWLLDFCKRKQEHKYDLSS